MTSASLAFSRDGRFFRRGEDRCLLRGITYGPFSRPLDASDACRRDLDDIARLGFNALRVFGRPSSAFLSACAEREIAVFVSLNWECHSDFTGREESIEQALRADVVLLRGEPAVNGYFVGNEVPAAVVRWIGVHRVRRFLDGLVAAAREEDAHRLISYANYPSTEYLQLGSADFASYNLYLEEEEALQRYLRRLHHLAGDRPLVISEYGLDSVRHGESRQADALHWMTAALFEGGAAGGFLFSYTDEWFNGGRQMSDWGFGIVSTERVAKPSAQKLSEWLPALAARPWLTSPQPVESSSAEQALPLVSVIVCTRNGHHSLPACLASLQALRYERVEILVVDDGSRPGIEALVDAYPGMRYLWQEHAGLSAARNRGVRESRGDLVAFTDDDCEVDREWLLHLVREFRAQGVDACGGPNLAPVVTGLMQRAIQWAPGNPTHVMLDDSRAEHLPGCNLAVTREAFEAIGGFAEHYRVAGDDVDFCWRLQFEGRRLGFAPNAWVWHHRRRTWRAFVKQQLGYGRAEALLHWDHPQKYSGLGGTDWKGVVYSAGGVSAGGRPVIYFGQDGKAPFQAIYRSARGSMTILSRVIESFGWIAAATLFLFLGLGWSGGLWIAGGMLLLSLGVSWRRAGAMCPSARPTWMERILLTWLCWSPALARQVIRWMRSGPTLWRRTPWESRVAFWSDAGVGREALLQRVRENLAAGQGVAARRLRPNQWAPFDVVLTPTWWAQFTLTTVTEYHDLGACLTRTSIKAFAKRGLLAVGALTAAWSLGQWLVGNWWIGAAGWAGLLAMAAGVHWHTARELRRRESILSGVVEEIGLKRMDS